MIYLGYYSTGFIRKAQYQAGQSDKELQLASLQLISTTRGSRPKCMAWHGELGTGEGRGSNRRKRRERIYWSGGASSKPAKAPCWLVPGCWVQTCTEDKELFCTETCRAAKPAVEVQKSASVQFSFTTCRVLRITKESAQL